MSNKDNTLYSRALAKPDPDRHPSYRYKLSICYQRSIRKMKSYLSLKEADTGLMS
jgi:hypothetical protein